MPLKSIIYFNNKITKIAAAAGNLPLGDECADHHRDGNDHAVPVNGELSSE